MGYIHFISPISFDGFLFLVLIAKLTIDDSSDIGDGKSNLKVCPQCEKIVDTVKIIVISGVIN